MKYTIINILIQPFLLMAIIFLTIALVFAKLAYIPMMFVKVSTMYFLTRQQQNELENGELINVIYSITDSLEFD